jgi:hypothetical protein
MNTATEATQQLQQALAKTRAAASVIDDLIVDHEYQDVALLVTHAAAALIDAAALLMQSDDEAALTALESADDLLDAVYEIIDSETDDE